MEHGLPRRFVVLINAQPGCQPVGYWPVHDSLSGRARPLVFGDLSPGRQLYSRRQRRLPVPICLFYAVPRDKGSFILTPEFADEANNNPPRSNIVMGHKDAAIRSFSRLAGFG
jgi:hypothetical protein